MFRRIAIVLAVLGAAVAAFVVATARQDTPAPPPEQPPSTNPYARAIVAIGVVEPAGRALEIAAPEPGRVVSVFAAVNDQVHSGDPLFKLDSTPIDAELVRAKAAAQSARAEVERLVAAPRPEDIPPAEAETAEAQQRYADARDRLSALSAAHEAGGASDDEFQRQKYLTATLKAAFDAAQARLDRLRAGAWSQDIAVARAALDAREADIRAIELRLERMTVRSPINGTVIKRNIEPGEWAQGVLTGGSAMPGARGAPFVLGDLTEMRVRAQIDEEDVPLLQLGAAATARLRGPYDIRIPLTMVAVEPLAGPKRQITGASTELIDTRVIEVIFRAQPAENVRLYTGQVVDVFIDVPQPPGPAPTHADQPPAQ